ncbi:hypothetical protein [Planctomycetes bacterium K23_9]
MPVRLLVAIVILSTIMPARMLVAQDPAQAISDQAKSQDKDAVVENAANNEPSEKVSGARKSAAKNSGDGKLPTTNSDRSDELAKDKENDDDVPVSEKNAAGSTVNDESSDASPARDLRLPLPTRLPDGRSLQAIGVFQSQVVDIIPRTYQPVSLERLSEAIGRNASAGVVDEDIQLRSSFYDVRLVDEKLISDHSVLDIRFRHQGTALRSLGNVNFALKNETAPDISVNANPAGDVSVDIESSATGELLAFLRTSDDSFHDAAIDFSWEKNGDPQGIYRTFQLQIPRTTQTRIVLSTPVDVVPETADGVLQTLPGPPPDADVQTRTGDVRWYTIDAGGLTSIKISVKPRVSDKQSTPTLIRSQSIRYELTPVGIDWVHLFSIESLGGSKLPPMIVDQGKVTSVRINNATVPFDQDSGAAQTGAYTVQPAIGGPVSTNASTRVSVSGTLELKNHNGWCDLPHVEWDDASVMVAHSSMDAQVIVNEPLNVVTWELPPNWTRSKTESKASSDLVTQVLRAEGPPNVAKSVEVESSKTENGEAAAADNSIDSDLAGQVEPAPNSNAPDTSVNQSTGKTAWSRIRFVRSSVAKEANVLTEFAVGSDFDQTDRLVKARSQFIVLVDKTQRTPLRLDVEVNWILSSVSYLNSGRTLEAAAIGQRGRAVLLWPEPEDILDGRLLVKCEGYRRVPATRKRVDLPGMWFTRLRDVRTETLLSIVPPANLNWTGSTVFHAHRVKQESLSDEELRFFSGVTEDTLFYKPRDNSSPKLSLFRPEDMIDVRTSVHFVCADNEIQESIIVSADGKNQSIDELSIQTQVTCATHSFALPDFRWSLHSSDGGEPISLPSTAVTVGDQGLYAIDLRESSLRNRSLLGRRQYPVAGTLQVTLPTTIGTASQEADVIIGDGLAVRQRDSSAQRVPLGRSAVRDSRVDQDLVDVDVTKAVRLRYEPNKTTRIEIVKLEADPAVNLIWHNQVDLTASSRGTDLVRGSFQVSATRPIRILYEPDLQLESLSHNGNKIDLASVPERPIVLQPISETDSIRAVWSRESIQRGWLRRCRIPRIEMEGVSARSDYRMKASADTFALGSFLAPSSDDSRSEFAVTVAQSKLLIHRNYALASGWLLSLLLFGAMWAIARRSLLIVASLTTVVFVAAILWWPWQVAIIGWIMLPMVAAAMLESSIQWNQTRISSDSNSEIAEEVNSVDFSVQKDVPLSSNSASGATLGLLLALIGSGTMLFATTSTNAAEVGPGGMGSTSSESGTLNVLVPIDENEQAVGDKVYVPGALYQELFGVQKTDVPSQVAFLSANYRIELENFDQQTEISGNLLVEADFVVHVHGNGNEVQLPWNASVIRRIEVRQGDTKRIVRFSPGKDGAVLAALPKGDRFQIHVVMVPTVSAQGDFSRLKLSIPKLASSQLLVQYDRTVDDVRVMTSAGGANSDLALRRWQANLGPVDELDLRFRSSNADDGKDPAVFRRQYLVSVGKTQTHIDCQVQLPPSLQVGDEFQFIVLDNRKTYADEKPVVTSAAWRLLRADSINPSRQRVTVIKVADVDAPLQLLWSRPSEINDATSRDDRKTLQLPDVSQIASKPFEPAWVAIDHASDLRVTLQGQGATKDLTAGQFWAEWFGLERSSQTIQTVIAYESLPSLITLQNQTAQAGIAVENHLNVGVTESRIDFRAVIQPSEFIAQRRTLRMPRNVRITRLTIDGNPATVAATQSDRIFELALGELTGTEPIVVEATATMRNPKSRLFSLVQIDLWPQFDSSATYTLTRDPDVQVDIVRQPSAVAVEPSAALTNQCLNLGQVLVASWKTSSSGSDSDAKRLVGRIKTKRKTASFDCDQFIKIDYVDGRWTMQVDVRFDGTTVPDVLDLEIPRRWCKSLAVSPNLVWTQHASTNPSLQVVRIASSSPEEIDSAITIRGELSLDDPGRVAVPRVEVLGAGQRKLTVSLPNRLTTEPILWDVRGVTADRQEKDRSIFVAQNDIWSIELAPMSDARSEPMALSADSRVLRQGDHVLVITRWDLVPNGLDAVRIRLPSQAKCLGAWSAGLAVPFETVDASADEIRIPLSLSRLAQPVEILINVPTGNTRRTDYLPSLVDIDVPDHWTAIFSPTEDRNTDDAGTNSLGKTESTELNARDQLRSLELARSVVEAIDLSLDTLAERPADEVATWLLPWILRYNNIAQGAGKVKHVSLPITDAPELSQDAQPLPSVVPSIQASANNSAADANWTVLAEKIRAFTQRFLTAEQMAEVPTTKPTFDAHHFDGYELSEIGQITPRVQPAPIEATSAGMHELRRTLANLLTLLMAGGFLFMLRPFQREIRGICHHPSFWLAVTGLLCLLVAPLPVALALLFVAITLAIVPTAKKI